MAYRAAGEPGETGEASFSVQELRARVGGFDRIKVYEMGREKVLGSRHVDVDASGAVTFSGSAGNSYLVYPDLGELVFNGYEVLCRLQAARFEPTKSLTSRICTQIYCTGDTFPASELIERNPELAEAFEPGDFPEGPIGGLGGGGDICEECLRPELPDRFYPVEGCDDRNPFPGGDPPPDKPDEDVVYVHKPYPFDAPAGRSQIYKMRSDGTHPVNLSNSNHGDYSPDVRHTDAKIVFASSRPGPDRLYTMDIDGGNVAVIPDTAAAGRPGWARPGDSFLVFTHPAWGRNSAIYRIEPDGSNKARITNPGPDQDDETADVLDGKHILFSRLDRANNFDRDLYIKYIWDNRPPQRLTNTPNQSEGLPVVSHDGQMFAYRVFLGGGQDDQVRVANLANGGLNVLHVIDLDLPATHNISGIDFSIGDEWLYVSTQADDVAGNLINRFQEIFCVRLAGNDQDRLTINSDADVTPSAVPEPH